MGLTPVFGERGKPNAGYGMQKERISYARLQFKISNVILNGAKNLDFSLRSPIAFGGTARGFRAGVRNMEEK